MKIDKKFFFEQGPELNIATCQGIFRIVCNNKIKDGYIFSNVFSRIPIEDFIDNLHPLDYSKSVWQMNEDTFDKYFTRGAALVGFKTP